MNIVCLKWGDKFSHEHVNRLYKMVKKNMTDDFNFICYTEDASNIHEDIIIKPLNLDYDLEVWWWKLCLFEEVTDEVNIFLDLDVIIQNDMTYLKDFVEENKICLVKCFWKPHLHNTPVEGFEDKIHHQFDMDINSSIIIWKGDVTPIWDQFINDPEFYMMKYKGIDSYIYYDHHDRFNTLPKGVCYSRLYGIDEEQLWKSTEEPKGFFKDPEQTICLFNGWKRKGCAYTKRVEGKFKYMLDDEGYDGFEKYWQD